MSEKAARTKQYEYRSNSNLVINQERDRNRDNEPTGEPESLTGRLRGRMGDRAALGGTKRDIELDEKLQKLKKRKQSSQGRLEERFRRGAKKRKLDSVLASSLDSVGYRPKTKETRQVYELILIFVQEYLGDQPEDVIKGASEEVITILKNDRLKAPEKKKEIEKILGSLTESKFSDLSDLVRKITDFNDDENEEEKGMNEETVDNELGVAVVFDEDEEEANSEEYAVEESDEEAEIVDPEELSQINTLEGMIPDEDEKEKDPYELDPKEIKAFWLKGQITEKIDNDPHNSQRLTEEILQILSGKDDRECENNLVKLLKYEKFDFIKLLLRNRWKIVYCTKLGRAESEEEKRKIEEEMKKDPTLASILDSLYSIGTQKSKGTSNMKTVKMKDKEIESSEKTQKAKTLIDLNALVFDQGSRLMTNKQCHLPPGSIRKSRPGFEEVYVPAPKPPEFAENEAFIRIEDLPSWAQKAFPRMTSLNRIQSRVFPIAFQSNENLLLCAPTGAGKTNVAMLTMLNIIGSNIDGDGNLDLENFKIIYIAPMKSLVQEMVGNFSTRLEPYGIVVKELTGDQNLTKQQLKETQIIVTTPEKWDIITRKSGDTTLVQLVKLIIIDEIHLLHDDRGPVLESIVARTLRYIETSQEYIRLVGLSATLPNYEDVATFLRVKEENIFAFDNSYRPCPLEQQYIGITEKKAVKRFQMMNEITYEKVMENAGKYQVLVFVHSRKETAKTAVALRDMAIAKDTLTKLIKEGSASREILQTEAEETAKNAQLKELLPYGFGIHHAGLARSDRTLVEDLFADGHIQVLVSTATLAWGVNLPAHTVIIKGTQVYSPEKGGWTELSPMDIMQMFGRSGRPQYDTHGVGIILTSQSQLQYCLSLMNQQLPIESQFISKLADNLNAEIVLGTVQSAQDGVDWLAYTYLYVCMLRNPVLYGISEEEAERDTYLEQRRWDLIHSAATVLDKANLIKYDKRSGNFQMTDLGMVASHYYVTYTSMAVYNEHLKPSMSDIELFRLFSLSGEFKYITIRQEEKAELEKLIERVPIPIKDSIDESSAKVNLLLQAYISRLRLEGLSIVADMAYITQSASRLVRALFEIVLKRGWAQLAQKCLNLAKMVDQRMWSSQSPLRQFKDIPEDIIKKIERRDFPFERLYDLNAQELGDLINFPSMGKTIYRHIHQFPKLELVAHFQPVTRSILHVELTITPDFQFEEKYHQNAEPFWILVEDVDSEKILHYEYFLLKKKFAEEDHVVSFTVPLFEPLHPQYFIRVVSDRWIGSESVLPLSFKHLILPEKVPPPTDLLDLQPLPISELNNPAYESIFASELNQKTFNPIQTQVFATLYNSDANAFIGVPTGSGKIVCAEFALFRLFNKNPNGRCVYITPYPALANERYTDWEKKIGSDSKLKKEVVLLTGDVSQDLKLVEKGNIIISVPEHWDLLSRRWKQRKYVQNVHLFLCDELHLIGTEIGAVYEVIISRMRFMISQLENKCRIVALAASVANARDLAEWIGASPNNCFNFHPHSRPIPLEIHVQGFDAPHFGTRLMMMSRPTLYAVSHHGQGKPTIIFVPNRKQARKTAKDLLTYVDTQDPNRTFLHCDLKDITPHLEFIQNKTLKAALSVGIAFYYEGLSNKEKLIIESLFQSGAVQILIASHELCWGMNLSASLIIIVGTQYYDGREHRYADYPISEILQMMGLARPTTEEVGKVVLFCFGPKKEFYKKFLYEPLPVESQLNHFLADHFNAEIVTKTIQNKQDAVDNLTWTFLYRRLTLNPNYYNLQGTSHRFLSDHLSELVEQTLADLEQSKCVAIQDEFLVSPLNLGMIACYYNIKYTTIELFNSSLSAKTRLKGLLEILSSASEFENLPIRQGEEKLLRKMAMHLPLKIEKLNYASAATKVNILLQSHFSRRALSPDLIVDLNFILEQTPRLIQALVDVISSNGWLIPALAAMELSQMITQALWDNDSGLKQLPHFDNERIERCKDHGVENIFALIDLDNDERTKLLKMTPKELQDVAIVCNHYPNIDLSYELSVEEKEVPAKSNLQVVVQLERELDENDLPVVHAPFYPKEKAEGWWLVIGEPDLNVLHTIKRITFQKRNQSKLEFVAPEQGGKHKFILYFMCDSYAGCDQEYEFELQIKGEENKIDSMEE